jgi:signal transduction histidine kinase
MVERLAMADVVERAVALVFPRARANGVLIESDVHPSPPVDGDASRLGQVVRNLLENAITHTPSGGRVTVTLQSRTDVVLLEVRDTGAGIAPEHLPFIFERFYRADRSRTRATGGAGLGLAIVKQLVEAHGGSVSASNAADSGALFTVELPMAQQRPSAQPAPATVPVPRPS